jgi:hypothetical protein
MESVKRIAMRMKLRKVEGTVVHHCALLCRMLNVKARVIKGFCVSPGEVCEHYWVRTDDEGLDLDLGMELACLYSPDLRETQTMLLEHLPEELKHVEVKKQEDNARLYELYCTDPKTFWRESPASVRAFSLYKSSS